MPEKECEIPLHSVPLDTGQHPSLWWPSPQRGRVLKRQGMLAKNSLNALLGLARNRFEMLFGRFFVDLVSL